ncbi:MAG: hypothetical protein ACTSX6_00235 [Candidatus Heimdallarchaeaceae archaeon]
MKLYKIRPTTARKIRKLAKMLEKNHKRIHLLERIYLEDIRRGPIREDEYELVEGILYDAARSGYPKIRLFAKNLLERLEREKR